MNITDEQRQIIHHPVGQHAKVLAVAGSGKTTTLAFRIKHLLDTGVATANQIQVLMFNADARRQFRGRLVNIGIRHGLQPPIDTFHSYALRLISKHDTYGDWYAAAGGNQAHIALMEARAKAARAHDLDPEDLDADALEQAIGLWKGALIAPEHAGYHGHNAEAYARAYREFETIRTRSRSITFDDFVPIAVQMMAESPEIRRLHTSQLRHIIIDEYQDINLGQQRMIELMAGRHADVIAVGDDDQTIYEWRGARSEYILREFAAVFDNRRHATYRLTRSFRFGCAIAQTAYNVISLNTDRQTKNLISWRPAQECDIALFTGSDSSLELANEIVSIATSGHAKPDDIRILGRTYGQLSQICVNLLIKKVPFTIIGATPFYQTAECRTLIDYIRLALELNSVPTAETSTRLLNVANRPNRFLRRAWLQEQCQQARRQRITLNRILDDGNPDNTGAARLLRALEQIASAHQNPQKTPTAEELLKLADQVAGVTDHYRNQYGNGERFVNRTANLGTLKLYAAATGLDWPKFLQSLNQLDTTQGLPPDQQLKLSTIHRVKGLEFDYVVIPDCNEGNLPATISNRHPTYDTRNPDNTPKATEWLESERRLFYVGATRARKALYIGAATAPNSAAPSSHTPSRFLEEMRLEHTLPISQAIADQDSAALRTACEAAAGYHIILRPLKEIYAAGLNDDMRQATDGINLSEAEKPFAYGRAYAAPRTAQTQNQGVQIQWSHVPEEAADAPPEHTLPPAEVSVQILDTLAAAPAGAETSVAALMAAVATDDVNIGQSDFETWIAALATAKQGNDEDGWYGIKFSDDSVITAIVDQQRRQVVIDFWHHASWVWPSEGNLRKPDDWDKPPRGLASQLKTEAHTPSATIVTRFAEGQKSAILMAFQTIYNK